MTDIHKHSLQDTDIDEDALLGCSDISGTELDYSDSLLASEDRKSETQSVKSNSFIALNGASCQRSSKNDQSLPMVSKDITPQIQATTEKRCRSFLQEQTSLDIKVDFDINERDYQSTIPDVLDLQRMAETFAEVRMTKLRKMENTVYEAGRFNYQVVTQVDKLLEQAHNMCYKYHDKLDRTARAKLLNMILALKELPHLYTATRREKGKSARRVTEWLLTQTGNPEPEMCDFMRQDPVQLRKFVSDIRPRLSTSDTNITLGKRKRGCEDSGNDDVTDVYRSSSDTAIHVHVDWSRPRAVGRRRKIKHD